MLIVEPHPLLVIRLLEIQVMAPSVADQSLELVGGVWLRLGKQLFWFQEVRDGQEDLQNGLFGWYRRLLFHCKPVPVEAKLKNFWAVL